MSSFRNYVLSIYALQKKLRKDLADPAQIRAPGEVDLKSRAGSRTRQLIHLHQLGVIHALNYIQGAQIKNLQVCDAYLIMLEQGNPHGMFLCARSLLEQAANAYEIRERLRYVAEKHASAKWIDAGQEFIKLLKRARFSASYQLTLDRLHREGAGFPKSELKPFNVMNCLKRLEQHGGFHEGALSRYAELCDMVHTNGSGHAVARSNQIYQSRDKKRDYWIYRYPRVGVTEMVEKMTLEGALRDFEFCVNTLKETPLSPFTQAQCHEITGHWQLPLPRSFARGNDPCLCDSGQKLSQCCGRVEK